MIETSSTMTIQMSIDASTHVARLTLNRPNARNALNNAMCNELHRALMDIRNQPDVHVVLINANGPVFCAGADLKERKHMDDDQIRARRLRAFALYDAIEQCTVPIVAIIDGPAVGSGCEIASACDFIIGSDRASFRYPEARWGTVGATQRLPRIVGRRLAKELMFTGRMVEADEALRIGLLNRVIPAAELHTTVERMAEEIASGPTHAMRSAKRTIDLGLDDTRHGALALEILAIEENLNAGTWKSGMNSFEKGNGHE
jgi:enoyl-CoA hydratase